MTVTLSRLKVLGGLFLAAILTVPAWAAKTAQPGSLNFVEGQVSIGDQPVSAQSVGNVIIENGQTLNTGDGRAEVLLTPGVFLRIDNNSSVQMNSLGLLDTEIVMNQGRAMIEADQIHSENNLRVVEGNMPTEIMKDGLYEFDSQGKVVVYKGQARVLQDNGQHVSIDGGHQLDFNREGKLKPTGFDKKEYQQSDLYRWSSLRSSYLADANVDAARTYIVNGYYGPGWVGPGWYWDPWFSSYTFIPGGGFFYNPFGWGFYSPIVVFRSPFFFGPHFVHTFGPGFHGPVITARPGVGFHGGITTRGPVGGGFRTGNMGFHGAGNMGFHGGGGGLHGGGGGFRR